MGMNKKQKKVVVIGLGIMLLMALIPPWKCIFKDRQLPLERPGGYGILFAPPHRINGWQPTLNQLA